MFRATVLAATTTNKASNLFGQVIHRVAKSQILVINSVRVLGSRLPIPTQLFWEYPRGPKVTVVERFDYTY